MNHEYIIGGMYEIMKFGVLKGNDGELRMQGVILLDKGSGKYSSQKTSTIAADPLMSRANSVITAHSWKVMSRSYSTGSLPT